MSNLLGGSEEPRSVPAFSKSPNTVLRVIVEDLAHGEPGLRGEDVPGVHVASMVGLCAGFEDKAWRADALASSLIEWIPEWVLPHSQRASFSTASGISALREAFRRVYLSKKSDTRGEIGELLLHMALRVFYGTESVITKIFFKDSPNDTVKGFDAIHVSLAPCSLDWKNKEIPELIEDAELEVWFGESKFYKNAKSAIRDVVDELVDHLQTDYLRDEFAAITAKIETSWPLADVLKTRLARENSLDKVFERAIVPVLITYDSRSLGGHEADSDRYREEAVAELREVWKAFESRLDGVSLPREVQIRLLLIPTGTKAVLIEHFDKKLKQWQGGL